ncbi:hypothetical protein J6590_061547 [Homalodisca vitripennis]|nr:hypothetical protein J6590_061547 [Homalodisca vitripennis]
MNKIEHVLGVVYLPPGLSGSASAVVRTCKCTIAYTCALRATPPLPVSQPPSTPDSMVITTAALSKNRSLRTHRAPVPESSGFFTPASTNVLGRLGRDHTESPRNIKWTCMRIRLTANTWFCAGRARCALDHMS